MNRNGGKGIYIRVPVKLWLMLALALLWLGFSIYVARPWADQLARLVGLPGAWLIVAGVALIPGYASAFVVAGLLFDWRPRFHLSAALPPITVLIAAYNEEGNIADTLDSFARQDYAAPLEIIVIDDGSTDRTREFVRQVGARWNAPGKALRLVTMPKNGGKAKALNAGLAHASHDLIVTVDADTLLFRGALENLVSNQLQSPKHTAATAGTVLVRNSRVNMLTRLQEWDYFLGIAVVKRIQSLLQGTLVAQGAISVYRKGVLNEIGGWPATVGEDIVLTWAMIERGYRIGYAENAFVFTNVPTTYGAYYRQRKRWSRGLIEAFKHHPGMVRALRLNTPFVWLNLLFPYLDFIYLFVFVPGVIAAVLFRFYAVVGLMTLLVIPLGMFTNGVMFYKQRAVFRQYGLKVRRNVLGAVFFTLAYQLVLSPASLMGYAAELFNTRKTW